MCVCTCLLHGVLCRAIRGEQETSLRRKENTRCGGDWWKGCWRDSRGWWLKSWKIHEGEREQVWSKPWRKLPVLASPGPTYVLQRDQTLSTPKSQSVYIILQQTNCRQIRRSGKQPKSWLVNHSSCYFPRTLDVPHGLVGNYCNCCYCFQ